MYIQLNFNNVLYNFLDFKLKVIKELKKKS